MNPRIINGWLVVDTNAPDHALVEIAVGDSKGAKAFQPAFRDYEQSIRVAKVRMPNAHGRLAAYVRIDGYESVAGYFAN